MTSQQRARVRLATKRLSWALAGLLAACGGGPTPQPAAEASAPEVEIAPPALHPHVLNAPEGVERWEPSGATVVGDKLWVVNDRGGWLAAYALPLAPGENMPAAAHQITPERLNLSGAT